MNYHLSRGGKDVGVFSGEELQRRRAAGELTGMELVWTEGMPTWKPLNTVLPQPASAYVPSDHKSDSDKTIVAVIVSGILIVGIVVLAFELMRIVPAFKRMTSVGSTGAAGPSAAMEAAAKPVVISSNTLTEAQVARVSADFRRRQYLEGYKLRGNRNPGNDAMALGLISNWIAANYRGEVNTNLPPIAVLGNRLANDPSCTDPLVLSVTAVTADELHESIRRLDRAVKGFENSRHLGYPKLFATEMLADKLIYDREDRLPVLDAQALQYFQAALTDGSIQAEDQAEVAEVLVFGWGKGFLHRKGSAICSAVDSQGTSFRWLGLVLKGENEINEAWRARGGGYRDTVSEAGWKGFGEHLAAARGYLTSAWELRPNQPIAPSRMIYVALGDSEDIGEMRVWFDRTVAAQVDYADAWTQMRWGLRPRWYGDPRSMLAFGNTALKTHRFDTDVPRMFFDSVSDVEAESDLAFGEHIYGREDIWPRLQEMYEGYLAAPARSDWDRDGWRGAYAVVAYLAGKYDVARAQLQPLNWQPHHWNLTGWGRDLSAMPLEVAARTGSQRSAVEAAEKARDDGDVAGALQQYAALAARTDADELTRAFIQDRRYTLGIEQRLRTGEWVSFLPTDDRFVGWRTNRGSCRVLPDGALEVRSDENGHLLNSRVRMPTDFEVRGQFEVVSSTSQAFQAGLTMGMPEFERYNWYAFRIKRNDDEHDVASFSQHWSKRQILSPVVNLDSRTNSFDFHYHDGRVTASVNGREVFQNVEPPEARVGTNEFLLGLGAFNDANSTVIRYRNIEVRTAQGL